MARKKERELTFQPLKPKHEPWRETTNHNYYFENDIKRLKGTALTNTEYVRQEKVFDSFQARIHLVKRSYDKTIPEGKTAPFNLTCNSGKFFPHPSEKMMTKDGAFTMNQKFTEYQVKDEE